jgi:hypothetical protein
MVQSRLDRSSLLRTHPSHVNATPVVAAWVAEVPAIPWNAQRN